MNNVVDNELTNRVRQLEKDNADLIEKNLTLTQIIDAVDAHVYWKDLAGKIVGINKANIKALGFKDKAEVLGRYDSDLIHISGSAAQMISDNDQNVMAKGESMVFEENSVDSTYLAQKNCLKDAEGKVIGIVGVSIDITDRKQKEKALATKTAELKAEKLRIQEFIHNFHHDLRTPITGVLSNLTLLKTQATKIKDDRFHRSLTLVSEGMYAISEMTEQLYLYTKESEESKERMRSCIGIDISKLVMQELNIAMISIGERNIILEHYFMPKHIPRFYGDYVKIMQILRNLLSNAVKYTHEGKIEVIVQIMEHHKESIVLRIKVADTGAGIANEDKERIFESGFRAEKHRKSDVHGTGFGLAIVKQNLDALNGKFGITSILGQGTEIWVDIPFKLA
ncbi:MULTISPECIES: PAS domain-containing sensor histidine kinase [Cysteiniphilum]|uniref:PAS domain-containing sensor histidine kinase n=1 Tax=Cysteiniphilum TaxID=2056696 RepID=UPI00177BFE93|nr:MULTISPECIES: PAS domain-containing sensor histidine kinase [Cysteiniphilum]